MFSYLNRRSSCRRCFRRTFDTFRRQRLDVRRQKRLETSGARPRLEHRLRKKIGHKRAVRIGLIKISVCQKIKTVN